MIINWEAIGAVGELLAAGGVILSLIYLATQIKHSIAATRSSTYQEIYRDLRANLDALSSEAMAKRIQGEPLTDAEKLSRDRWILKMMRTYENWWQQKQYGSLDEKMFDAYISHMKITLWTPGARAWWTKYRSVDFIPEFEAFVARHMEEHPPQQFSADLFPTIRGDDS